MSVSSKSGGCNQKCIPCSAKSAFTHGVISTAGGAGTIGPDAANLLCEGADDACKQDLANKIADMIRSYLPSSWFGDTCYECEDLRIALTRAECSCGEFTGSISMGGAGGPGTVRGSCAEVPCGAQPVN